MHFSSLSPSNISHLDIPVTTNPQFTFTMSQPSDPVSPFTSHLSVPVSFPSRTPLVHHLRKLKADLEKVAASPGNVYERKVALLVRWDNDTTGETKDIGTMTDTMKTFGIQCTNFLLQAKDEGQGSTLRHKISTMIAECRASKVHSLFVFYYVGHGAIAGDGSLYFVQGDNGISWTKIRGELVYDVYEEKDRASMRRVDVLCVLDCCYSGAATRAGATAGNVAQVLAACGPRETTQARDPSTSFTMRLFSAAHHFRQAGQATVSTAALFQRMQEERTPTTPHAVLETLLRHVNEKRVLVKLTLHGRSPMPGHSDVFENFKQAIQNLPPNMKVEISDAYETDQSIFIILGMSWEAWALWTMVAHLDFVGVTFGLSLMRRRPVESSGPISDENHRPSAPSEPSHGKGKAE
ncbi:uncharacterized protein N7515_003129 [Penicillium bovifimosum]|uniref:Peptidase C14 caspase domain-containing protein n=1 Tax=Penicillium bovifimosum TaxID=126998 RepID=A0A9W9H4I7_9EURO|nr:uncharacterized protein N7515_003129 [Penicillium bovifimosum]KAJ5138281.1 hypothetical protein N7515_003129 [Penicillium bovifimosum]